MPKPIAKLIADYRGLYRDEVEKAYVLYYPLTRDGFAKQRIVVLDTARGTAKSIEGLPGLKRLDSIGLTHKMAACLKDGIFYLNTENGIVCIDVKNDTMMLPQINLERQPTTLHIGNDYLYASFNVTQDLKLINVFTTDQCCIINCQTQQIIRTLDNATVCGAQSDFLYLVQNCGHIPLQETFLICNAKGDTKKTIPLRDRENLEKLVLTNSYIYLLLCKPKGQLEVLALDAKTHEEVLALNLIGIDTARSLLVDERLYLPRWSNEEQKGDIVVLNTCNNTFDKPIPLPSVCSRLFKCGPYLFVQCAARTCLIIDPKTRKPIYETFTHPLDGPLSLDYQVSGVALFERVLYVKFSREDVVRIYEVPAIPDVKGEDQTHISNEVPATPNVKGEDQTHMPNLWMMVKEVFSQTREFLGFLIDRASIQS